jgi:hypothetical protein
MRVNVGLPVGEQEMNKRTVPLRVHLMRHHARVLTDMVTAAALSSP